MNLEKEYSKLLLYISVVGYYPALSEDNFFISLIWVSLENIMLTELSHIEEDRRSVASLTYDIYKSELGSRMVVKRGWDRAWMEEIRMQLKVYKISLRLQE